MTPATSGPKRTLAAIALAYFLSGCGMFSTIGLLPFMSSGLAVSNAAIAQLLAVHGITFALTAPVIQLRVHNVMRSRLLAFGLLAFAFGALGMALGRDYPEVFVARIFMALGAGVIGPVGSLIAADALGPAARGRALAVVFSGFALSSVAGLPLVAWVAQHADWRTAYLGLAGLAVCCAGAVLAFVGDCTRMRRAGAGVWSALRSRAYAARGLLVTALHSGAQATLYTLIVAVLLNRFALPEVYLPGVLAALGVGGVVGTLLGGKLADQKSAPFTIRASLAGMSVTALWLSLCPPYPALGVLGALGFSTTATLFQASQTKLILSKVPVELSGVTLSLNAACSYAGLAAGAAAGALAYQSLGVSFISVSTLAFLLAAAALFRRKAVEQPAA